MTFEEVLVDGINTLSVGHLVIGALIVVNIGLSIYLIALMKNKR